MVFPLFSCELGILENHKKGATTTGGTERRGEGGLAREARHGGWQLSPCFRTTTTTTTVCFLSLSGHIPVDRSKVTGPQRIRIEEKIPELPRGCIYLSGCGSTIRQLVIRYTLEINRALSFERTDPGKRAKRRRRKEEPDAEAQRSARVLDLYTHGPCHRVDQPRDQQQQHKKSTSTEARRKRIHIPRNRRRSVRFPCPLVFFWLSSWAFFFSLRSCYS